MGLLRNKKVTVPAIILSLLIYITSCTLRSLAPSNAAVQRPLFDPNVELRWTKRPEKYPVKSYIPIPTDTTEKIPQIQYDFPKERTVDRSRRLERRKAVKEAFLHAWEGYKQHAWGKDEVTPITGKYDNPFGGWAATLVDSLDSLLIMGLTDEFEKALEVVEQIDFHTTETQYINVFETNIRYLGGLLAAHDLTDGKYPVLLKKAVEVGEFLYAAFDTPNRMQMARWDWRAYVVGHAQKAQSTTLLAELGSLSLEFTRLTQLTGDPKYFDAIQRVTNNLEEAQMQTAIPGLWPVAVNAEKLLFTDKRFTVGGMADSTYEYLPKEHLLLNGSTKQYRRMWEAAMKAIKDRLLFRPMTENGEDVLFAGNVRYAGFEPEAQHLTCFLGGTMAIAAKMFNRPDELSIARKLVDGCIWAYDLTPTGLMPEIFHVVKCADMEICPWDEKAWLAAVRRANDQDDDVEDPDESARQIAESRGLPPGITSVPDGRYILRPEAIESVFIMYRITGDKTLQDAAWRMFTAIEKMCRTKIAHASVADVRFTNSKMIDKMESFWLAETLKYFYLIFSEPDLISLDDYVFNTEAHPLRRSAA